MRLILIYVLAACGLARAAEPPRYPEVRERVIGPRCNSCHDGQSRVRFTDYDLTVIWLDAIDRTVFKSGSMPQGPKLSADEMALLRAWIDGGARDRNGKPAQKPEPYPGPLEANYASIRWHIFQQKCLSCHGHTPHSEDAPLGDYRALLEKGSIIPGDPKNSPLYLAVDRYHFDPKIMPPPDSGIPFLTPQELIYLKMWIEAGAPERR